MYVCYVHIANKVGDDDHEEVKSYKTYQRMRLKYERLAVCCKKSAGKKGKNESTSKNVKKGFNAKNNKRY